MPPAAAAVGAVFAASAAFEAGIALFGTTLVAPGLGAAAVAGLGSLALGFASQALAPKPPKPPGATPLATSVRENTFMVRQAITARRLVYGWTRVSGPQTFVHSTNNDEKLHILLTLSTHQVSRMDALLLDDEVVPLDGSGNATGKYAGKVRAFFGDGTTSGDSTLHSELRTSVTASLWSTSHLQTGCAKIYVELSFDSDLFPVGVPNISVIMRGKNDISDPRGGTGWTDNAALCINDWLKSEFGYNWPSADIDSTALTAAANVCDEMVSRNPALTFTANASTDVITIGADLPANTRFRVSTTGTLPAGLSATTTYFYIRSSTTTGKVATSEANVASGTAVDITDAGSGTHTFTRVVEFTVDASTDVITLTDKKMSLRTGTRFQVSSDGTLPAGLSAATNYFWIALTPTTGKVATSLVNSRAGTAVDITSAGSGIHVLTVNAEPRYTLNGVVDTEQGADETLAKMLSAMAGLRITQGKTIFLYAGAWRAPTVTLDEDDLAGGISVQARRSRRDVFNGVKGVFSNPDDLWQPTDFPAVQVASYVTEDQSTEIWRDAELPYTNSPTMAMRISRIDLERARRQISTNWPCKLTALRIAGADVISLTNTRMGWTAKSFEVGKWIFAVQNQRDAPVLGIDLECREVDANIYAWTPGTDEAVLQPAKATTLPDPFTVAAPTGLTLTSGTTVLGTRLDGTIFSRILVQWTAPASIFVTSGGFIEGEVRKNSEASNWRPAFTVRGDVTQAYVLDVDDGVAYVVRIRGKTILGTTSDWTTSAAHTVVGKTAAPSDITTFSAQQNGNVVIFRWTAISDLDLSGYEIRFMQAPFVWEDALVLTAVTKGTQITSAAVPPSPIDPTTNLQIPWVFGIKAVDTSKNYSTNALTTTLVVLNTFDVIKEQQNWPVWRDWPSGRTLRYARYENKFLQVNSANATGLYIKEDKVFTLEENGDIVQRALSSPWDISTATSEALFSVSSFATTPVGLTFKPDGTKFYVVDVADRQIEQYNLSSAWNILTASRDSFVELSAGPGIGFSYSAIAFKPDGTKLFAAGVPIGSTSYMVERYSLSTPWIVSTASRDGNTYVTSGFNQTPVGLQFSPDGDRMFLCDTNNKRIIQIGLLTPWDLTTSHDDGGSFTVNSSPLSIATNIEISKVYVGTGRRFDQYKTEGGFYRNPWTGNLNPLDQSSAGGDNFNVFNNYIINPVSFAVFEGVPIDTGLDLTTRIWVDVGAKLRPDISSGAASAVSKVDYRTSTSSFDGFETWTVGDAEARYVKARVESDAGKNPTRLTRFTVTADGEERIEVGSVSIVSGGTLVTFTEAFANIPQVRTWNAQQSAKIPGFDTVTTSTFKAYLFDTSNNQTSGVNFWEARGV